MLKEAKLYGKKITIRFDDESHIFYDEEGNKLISVTGATGVIDKSAALMGWATKMMGIYLVENWDLKKIKTEEEKIELIETAKKEYRRIKLAEADVGKAIHEWVSDWIKGKKPEMPLDEKVVNGITAFLKFQKEHQIKWLESERVVYSRKHRFAGILDAVGKMGDDLVLFDFKSSNGIYPEMWFQVAGYQIAWEEETGKRFDKKMLIRFGKDDGKFESLELGKDGKDKEVFLACLKIKERLREMES